jgi:DNA-binding response OmpR family regulator
LEPNVPERATDRRVERKLVLLVEDDVEVRRMFRTALMMADFAVREVGDGYDALVALEQHPPDLVVLDLGLPRLHGLTVQAEIAARVLTKHTPVVIVTGEQVDLTAVNVACVLRKPVLPELLVATVAKCLVKPGPVTRA